MTDSASLRQYPRAIGHRHRCVFGRRSALEPEHGTAIGGTRRGASGMPAPLLHEDCRTLLAILPVSPAERFPNAWAFALRHFLSTEHAGAVAFVGIYVDDIVIYPAENYADEAPRLVQAGVTDLAADGFDVGSWRMGEPRTWGFNDLCPAVASLRGEMAGDGIEVVGPLDSGHLEVLVSDDGGADHPAIAALEARFADLLVVTVSEGVFVADVRRLGG